MRRRRWIWWTAAAVVLLAVAAGVLYQWFTGPMYRPGDVRAQGVAVAPQDGVRPGYWRMEPGVDVVHSEQGRGRKALVIHGGPCMPYTNGWAAAERLADFVEFVYYHQRGCGDSSRPVTTLAGKNTWEAMQELNGKLGLPAQIADIERIRRLLGEEKLTIVGHSFGGFLAALYAAEYPEHVERMVLVSPADLAVMPGNFDLFGAIRERLPEGERPGFDRFLERYLDFSAVGSWTEESVAASSRKLAEYYLKASGLNLQPPRGMGGLATMAMYLSMGRRHDYSDALRRIEAPVLIIHGSKDMQPRAISDRFAARLPNARVVELPAGHFSFDEAPEAFAEAVRPFLRNALT